MFDFKDRIQNCLNGTKLNLFVKKIIFMVKDMELFYRFLKEPSILDEK